MKAIQVGKILLLCFMLLGCKEIKTDKSIIGKSIKFTQKKYGVFETPKEIVLNSETITDLYEYQNEIIKHCPEIKNGDTVLVKEYYKDMSDTKRIIIWERKKNSQWLIFDNIIFNPKKIKF